MSDKPPTWDDVVAARRISPIIHAALYHEDTAGREAVLCAMVVALAEQNARLLHDMIATTERHLMPTAVALAATEVGSE